MTAKQDNWTGRTGFILATIGSAVGIGSIWKFPYEVGSNGGGAFVLFYLLGLVVIVVPLMLAEFAIGRHGRGDAIQSILVVARNSNASPAWAAIGLLGAVTGFLVLSFYSVIGGWTLAYAIETVRIGVAMQSTESAQTSYDALLAAPMRMTLHHTLFMGVTAVIVARGIAHGIEAACKVLMPVLIVLIVLLAVYSIVAGDVVSTVRFLFAIDPAKLTARVALDALGLGFFSIGVGFAIMVTYAAHAGRDVNLSQVVIVSVAGDTAISLLAGFAVFPIVFANGLDPASGPGLIFVTLPLAFSHMPAGTVVAIAFYTLLLAAALASAISLLELVVAPLMQRGWSRASASGLSAFAVWLAGLATILSFNQWAAWHPFAGMPGLADANWFEAIDHLTSNVMLPLGGLALAIFTGWIVPDRLLRQELGIDGARLVLLRALLRWVAPIGIAAVTLVPYLR